MTDARSGASQAQLVATEARTSAYPQRCMPPTEIIIAGGIAFLAILLLGVLLARWLSAQTATLAIAPKGPCGFMPPT
jgi:hypothetical protein